MMDMKLTDMKLEDKIYNSNSNSNTVFINECDKRTNSKERNKERNRSNGKLKKFK